MAKYKITDPQSGKTVTISGDKPPTQADAEEIFSKAGLRDNQPVTDQQIKDYANKNRPKIDATANPLMQLLQKGQQGAYDSTTGATGNDLSAAYLPRLTAQARQQGAGRNVSLDQRIGGVGEAANRLVAPVLTAMGAPAPATLGITGAIEGATEPGALPESRTANAALQGVSQYTTTKAAEALFGLLGAATRAKSINPAKIALNERNIAVGKTPTIDTSQIVAAGDRAAKLFPHSADDWEIMKAALPDQMPTQDLLDVVSSYGHNTYSATGNVKDKATADLTNQLYKAARQTIKDQAPEVAKQTSNLRNIIVAPKVAQKASWLALKVAGLGKLVGL
jgi:hypothetical protein